MTELKRPEISRCLYCLAVATLMFEKKHPKEHEPRLYEKKEMDSFLSQIADELENNYSNEMNLSKRAKKLGEIIKALRGE